MIANPEWQKPKEKPYFRQTKLSAAHVSLDYIEKLAECMESIDKEEIDCDTCFEMEEQILTEEINDPEFFEFAIENLSEMFGCIAKGNLNIRIHRDITGLPDGLFGG